MSPTVVVRRLAVNVAAAALLGAVGSLLHAQAVPVNNPPVAPRSILVFPQRDFVSSSGFANGDLVTVEVFHPGSTIAASAATNVVPQDDPATPDFDGIVEVNHPGGACWEKVTPDIRPGDRVRTTRRSGGVVVGVDETTVANVIAKRPVETGPGTVQIHGTAQNPDGTPLDIAQLEQRLVAPRDAFDANGRRTLRAVSAGGGGDGVIAYDAAGSTKWTATYTNLDAADVTRALNAESRIMWLGANPAATVESTIYEIGAGITAGPSAPCAAPLEKLPPPPGSELIPPSVPSGLTATLTGSNTVSLTWSPSTDNVGVTSYGVYRNGVAIANVETIDATAPAPTAFDDFNVPAGTYTYTVDAADAVGNRSAQSTAVSIETAQQQAMDFPLCSASTTSPCVSDPPGASPTQVQIIAFPARDFTSSSGYTEQDSTVAVQVIRNGLVISTASVIPVDDPTTVGFDGIVEVNHPGGGCWMGVTPDLRPGDIVRQIAYASDGTIRRVDQGHVSNISVRRPIVIHPATAGQNDGAIEVHGTAIGADGNPIPIDQLNQRLVVPRDRFDLNGRRTLRAGLGEDGVLAYDTVNNADGIKFTATYTGLDENDVARAVGGTTSTGRTFTGAESRILFLGLPTVIAPEMTIYENSDLTISGPSAGACTAPLEALDTDAPGVPTSLTATQATNSTTVHLAWAASTDNTYVNGYGIYRDGVRIHNVGGSVTSYDDFNVPSGDHTYAVDAVDTASPLKVNYPPVPNDPNATDPILQGVEWGNRSAKSVEVTVSQPDVIAPSVPANVVGTATANLDANQKIASWSIAVTWQKSTDNVGVTSYGVYHAGVRTDVAAPSTTFTETVPANNTSTPVVYTYQVDAADQAGNRSAQSAPVSVSIAQQADNSAPTTPANLRADTRDVYSGATAPALGTHDVKLSWSASTDNVGVAGYRIYRRTAHSFNATSPFTFVADVNGSTLTFVDTSVPTGTYDYTIDAVDSASNRSAQAAAVLDVASVDDVPQGTHSIIPFPQRDFVSSTGYKVSEGPIVISVIRNGKVWARSTPINVVGDPATPGLGAAEVNHPGGGCWDTAKLNGLDGITPDLRPGDIVRFTNTSGIADQTTTANVWADRPTEQALDGTPLPPGTIQVHGTAQDALGNPLPISQIESRLIASSATPFDVNGRRTLRALGDGTIAYDPIDAATNPKGINWTATFSGLDAADLDLALAAESRAVWLGRDPLAGTELTIFENGDGVVGGPAGPDCTAPAEAGPAIVFAETGAANPSFDPATLSLPFPTVNTGSAITKTLTLTNVGSADAARAITGTLSIASAAVDFLGDFTLTGNTCAATTVDLNGTCTVTVQFAPLAPGVRMAHLVYSDNANNSPVQAIALSGEGHDAQAPVVTAPVQTFLVNSPMNVPANSLSVNVSSTATDASGVASMQLDVSTDGGRTWRAVKSSTSGQIAATMTFTLGTTYQFRASATDAVGNASAPVASAPYRVSISDDNSGTPKFSGSWTTQKGNAASAGAYGNTVHEATAPQAGKTNTVTFTFTGTEVALLAAIGPDRGQVSMSVDGGAARTIDLYAAAQQQATVVGAVAGLGAGSHTVTVNVLGTRNASSTNTRVDIDAFAVKF